jgi:hypothetical protein
VIVCLLLPQADVKEVKDTFSSIQRIVRPLVNEIEGEEEMHKIREDNDYMDEIQVTVRPTQISDAENCNINTRYCQL